MQKKSLKRTLSLLVCSALIAAAALCTGCSGQSTAPSDTSPVSEAATSEAAPAATEAPATADTAAAAQVLGEGATAFTFTVVDGDGSETYYEIHTDAQTVGDALTELGLIEGEDSEYGLYVKTVNGITADYDTDGHYWAFYMDGEYAQTGVDATQVTAGASYAFKVE